MSNLSHLSCAVPTRRETNRRPKLLSQLKDPQVWVCAIAAFTLIGLSTGMLDPAEPAAHAQMMASAGK